MSTDKKIVLITGANTGLGYEVLKAVYQDTIPYEIILGCRTVSKGEEAIETLKKEVPSSPGAVTFSPVLRVDYTSDASLEAAVKTVESTYGKLDMLINNGGAAFDLAASKGQMSLREAFTSSWDVNVAGAHILTTLAMPLLLKSDDPRLMFVTSGTASLYEHENPQYAHLDTAPPKGWPKPADFTTFWTYRTAKTGLNMLMREWVRYMREDGVKIWAISPGFLATGLNGVGSENLKKVGALDPAVGGNFIKDVMAGKRDADVGKVIRNHMIQPW